MFKDSFYISFVTKLTIYKILPVPIYRRLIISPSLITLNLTVTG